MGNTPVIHPGSLVQRLGLRSIRAAEDCLFTVYSHHYSEEPEANGLGSAIDEIWNYFWEVQTYEVQDPEGKVYV